MQEQEYMKFLKKRTMAPIPIGENMPTPFAFDRAGHEAAIDFGPTGTVIFFMSKTCEKCDFSLLSQYSETFRFKTYLFVDADDDFASEIERMYPGFEVFKSDLTVLFKEIRVEAVPLVYAVNKVGQIVGGGLFNTYESLTRKISPLIEVFGSGSMLNENIS
ncbi:hypothetical protein [Paenibacillus cookii]|uniref:Thioredoxin domain-containing protein n=1 Tax=Paenibacillus cookii TaxID=157839 RepID=A0ABQ4LUS8_9BACL|nr:hypothetical protein [Paenibacillus cookii]GIO67032.1 hypothetical protein J21TS3_18530 [Paenibacillus cookii]